MKNTITKIENSKDVFKNRLDTAEKSTSELEDMKVENVQNCEGSEILPYLRVSLP